MIPVFLPFQIAPREKRSTAGLRGIAFTARLVQVPIDRWMPGVFPVYNTYSNRNVRYAIYRNRDTHTLHSAAARMPLLPAFG